MSAAGLIGSAFLVAPLLVSPVAQGATTGVSAKSAPAAISAAARPYKFKNCAALNKKFPHGVGKVGARDKTSTKDKVTNFKRSNAWYAKNTASDRDKDGIACEKR